MNKQIKSLILVLITAFLLSACGWLATVPASTDTPEPVIVVTEIPTEAPTASPTEEVTSGRFDQYIGLVYPPLADDLSPRFSMVVQGSDDNGMSLFMDGGNRMLWLSKLYGYDESGNPTWQVADILDLSNIEAGAALIPDGCSLNGQVDNRIVAVGKRGGAILLAWRINTELDSFEPLAGDGLKCDSDKLVIFE